MNVYGFCPREASGEFAVNTFLIENTRGFGRAYGFKNHQIKVGVAKDLQQEETLIANAGCPMDIIYSKRAFRDLHEMPSYCAMRILWFAVCKTLRRLLIRHEHFSPERLLPTSYLRGSYEDLFVTMCKRYVEKDWDTDRLREEIDSAYIGMSASRIVAVRVENVEEFSQDQLEEIIFRADRRNWTP